MKELEVVVQTISMFFVGMINFIRFIPASFAYITQVLSVMPVELVSYMLCFVTAGIVLLILGRN